MDTLHKTYMWFCAYFEHNSLNIYQEKKRTFRTKLHKRRLRGKFSTITISINSFLIMNNYSLFGYDSQIGEKEHRMNNRYSSF
jgi:hypothetical protein